MSGSSDRERADSPASSVLIESEVAILTRQPKARRYLPGALNCGLFVTATLASLSRRPGTTLPQNSHALSDALEHLQRLLQLFLGVRCSHDGADAGLALRHRRKRDAGAQHAFFEQLAREPHGQLAIADDNGRDWSLAGRSGAPADVEPQQAEFFFPEARVLPKPLYALGLIFQNVECCDASGGH